MQWYTRRADGAEKGPFDDETLRGALARGELARTTLVRREDEEEWAPIGKGERLSSEPPTPEAATHVAEQPAVPGNKAARQRLPRALEEDERASPALRALGWIAFAVYATHGAINLASTPRREAVMSADLAGSVLGAFLITFLISWVVGQFRTSKSARTKAQTFLIVCLALEGLQLAAAGSIAAVKTYQEKARTAPSN